MTPSPRTLRGKVAVAGIGETTYYKHGKSPDAEFALALQAILRACEDAGIAPREIDGFACARVEICSHRAGSEAEPLEMAAENVL